MFNMKAIMKAFLSFYIDLIAILYCANKAILRVCIAIKKALRAQYKQARALEITLKYKLNEKK